VLMVQMRQEERACARDLAVLEEKTALQAQIHYPRAQDGDLVGPVGPPPVAVATVASAEECAVKGIH